MSIQELLDTPSLFRAWLEQQPEGRQFERASRCRCPIAAFLRANGFENAMVGIRLITVGCSENSLLIPYWVREFTRTFDYHAPVGLVGPRETLNILTEIEAAL